MTCPSPREKRTSFRFNKVFLVRVRTEDFAEITAVARNISEGGMLIETPASIGLGTTVEVRFQMPDGDESIVAVAEVKNHYAFNFYANGRARWARGLGVRFLEFLSDGGEVLRESLTRIRTLH